jgi:hypothetical protein
VPGGKGYRHTAQVGRGGKVKAGDDVARIRVGGSSIGIMGLRTVMEDMSGEYADKPDQTVREELLDRLGKRNYIPATLKEEYATAFLREFRRFLGEPFEEEARSGLEIKVLGPGCARCDALEQALMDILSELNIKGDIEHVRDIKEIGRYGVMGSPALLINGQVMAVGKIPPKLRLIEWLKEAEEKLKL